MAEPALHRPHGLSPLEFRDPFVTADGQPRAHVALRSLETIWFNTGTLCNPACRNCYMESSPTNADQCDAADGQAPSGAAGVGA